MKFYELLNKIYIFDKRKNKYTDVCCYFDELEKSDFINKIIVFRN